jgi:hypothetical protein
MALMPGGRGRFRQAMSDRSTHALCFLRRLGNDDDEVAQHCAQQSLAQKQLWLRDDWLRE